MVHVKGSISGQKVTVKWWRVVSQNWMFFYSIKIAHHAFQVHQGPVALHDSCTECRHSFFANTMRLMQGRIWWKPVHDRSRVTDVRNMFMRDEILQLYTEGYVEHPKFQGSEQHNNLQKPQSRGVVYTIWSSGDMQNWSMLVRLHVSVSNIMFQC